MIRHTLMIIAILSPASIWAQTDSKNATPPDVVRVVNLSHASAGKVMAAIHELNFPTRSSVVADNRLVLRGAPGDIQLVLDELVAKIDVPEVGVATSTIDYIPLSQRPPDRLEALIEAVAPRDFGTHYAIDPSSRLIAVNAPKEKVASIRKLVEATDRASDSYLIHFYFLRGTVGGGVVDNEGAVLPKDVASVATALQTAGFGDLTLVGPMIIQGVDGEWFESSVEQARDGREQGDDHGIHVRGQVFADGSGSVVQIELDVALVGRTVQRKESGTVMSYPKLLAAESTITVRLDSCVVLAAVPTADANGEAYAVAVKVTRAGTGKR